MKFPYQKLPIHQSADPSTRIVARPYLPIYLHSKAGSIDSPFYALLDSGADNILMQAELAEAINITDIKMGRGPIKIVGVAGQVVDVYFHEVEIQVLGSDQKIPVLVGFGEGIELPLLGRAFFEHFRKVTFDEQKEEVELHS